MGATQEVLDELAALAASELIQLFQDYVREGRTSSECAMSAVALAIGAAEALSTLPHLLFPGDATAPGPVGASLKQIFIETFDSCLADAASRVTGGSE